MVGDDGRGEIELPDGTAVGVQEDTAHREVVFFLPEVARSGRGLAEVAVLGGRGGDAEFARRDVGAVKAERDAGLLRRERDGVSPGARLGVR